MAVKAQGEYMPVEDKEFLEAIGKMMDEKLNPINKRLSTLEMKMDRLQADVDDLKEYSEITREGVNTLLGWADKVAHTVKVPLESVN